MGIFRALNRAVDAVDNAITDARVHSGAHREARKWAAGVWNGTVYSTETHNHPVGGTHELVHEHQVRNGKIGHQSVEGWYLTASRPSKTKPRGMTKAEYDAYEVAGPDAGKAVGQTKRGLFGGRKAA